jgi:predicted HicB family RNase H-like nuclease
MPNGSADTSRRGEKTACVGTWLRPEVKRRVEREASQHGQSVSQYLRELLHEKTRQDELAAA